MTSDYLPSDCTYHDQLLDLATLRTLCEIVYRDLEGQELVIQDVIKDVYTNSHKEEFMTLRSGLSRLI